MLAAVGFGFRESVEEQDDFFFGRVGVFTARRAPSAGLVIEVGDGELAVCNERTPVLRRTLRVVETNRSQRPFSWSRYVANLVLS